MFDVKAHKDYLIEWMKNFIERTNAKGIVLGISGGVDSAVIAHLAKEAGIPTIGVWMDINSSNSSKRNALRVFEDSQIGRKMINLTPVWENMLETLNNEIVYKNLDDYNKRILLFGKNNDNIFTDEKKYLISIANVKSRLRMTTLYQVAQQHEMLVSGTSNAVELYLGYFTKWGDGAADFSPISNLMKSEVYLLAKELGVNERIINAAPSADLWEGQTDEEHIGVSYDDVEKYINGEDIPKNYVKIIEKMHKLAQHKLTSDFISPEYKMS